MPQMQNEHRFRGYGRAKAVFLPKVPALVVWEVFGVLREVSFIHSEACVENHWNCSNHGSQDSKNVQV